MSPFPCVSQHTVARQNKRATATQRGGECSTRRTMSQRVLARAPANICNVFWADVSGVQGRARPSAALATVPVPNLFTSARLLAVFPSVFTAQHTQLAFTSPAVATRPPPPFSASSPGRARHPHVARWAVHGVHVLDRCSMHTPLQTCAAAPWHVGPRPAIEPLDFCKQIMLSSALPRPSNRVHRGIWMLVRPPFL